MILRFNTLKFWVSKYYWLLHLYSIVLTENTFIILRIFSQDFLLFGASIPHRLTKQYALFVVIIIIGHWVLWRQRRKNVPKRGRWVSRFQSGRTETPGVMHSLGHWVFFRRRRKNVPKWGHWVSRFQSGRTEMSGYSSRILLWFGNDWPVASVQLGSCLANPLPD